MDNKLRKISDLLAEIGMDEEIPSLYEIWLESNRHYEKGDIKAAKLYQNLNLLLHNSSVPYTTKIGKNVKFAYEGIGLVLHYNSIIEDYATIGSNVTLGGRGGSKASYTLSDGTKMRVPRIGKYTYLATGSKILGGIDIGACSIVGANSVVLDHVPPCSVVAGVPARMITRIDETNIGKYKNNFTQFRKMSDIEISEKINFHKNERRGGW